MSDKNLAGLSSQEKRALLKELLARKGSRNGAGKDGARNVADLRVEAVLDESIQPSRPTRIATDPSRVFLTGATGFLGAFLLHEILRRTGAEVFCLARARDAAEGAARIRETLESYSLWEEGFERRIVPVPGDLSEPLFGLSEAHFRELSGAVEAVYHCGASVNWVYPYEKLKPANVLGTQEALRLAAEGQSKPLHFVSTLGVFPLVGNVEGEAVGEDDALDHGGTLYNGYVQSKWVAEKLVEVARARGLPASVYRPALITGSSRTGAWNTEDFTCRVMKSWVDLGVAPEVETSMNLIPVDYASEAIVHLSLQKDSPGKNFHLAGPVSVTPGEMADWFRAFGYPLRRIPYDRWRTALTGAANGLRGLNSLAPIFSLGASADAPEMVREIPEFDCRNTLEGLSGTAISCPPVDERMFARYLSFLVRRGFLDAPGNGGA